MHRGFVLGLVLVAALMVSSCAPSAVSMQTGARPVAAPTPTAAASQPAANMPNPAAVFCEKNGGKVDIRKDAKGNEYGVCVFVDGSECDEWAYFRGECKPGAQKAIGMPNPASVNCTEKGGKLDIRKDAKGGETGVCVFPDGSECEEWAFFRGACKPGAAAVIGMPNPASVYCDEQGGKLDIRKDAQGGEYGVCVFADGSECDEWAFFRGECKPGAIPVIGMPNPASAYCVDQGGALEMRKDAQGNEVGICVFGDGSECDEWAFFRNECEPGSQPMADMVNPAAVYCDEQGGKEETRKDAKGNEVGVCTFADGSECDEWAFFRGECKPGGKKPAPVTPVRITFQPGATSETVQDDLPAGGLDRYVLRAGAGQSLSLNFTALRDALNVRVRGADGKGLLDHRVDNTVLSVRLPAAQDYVIDVQSLAATPVGYVMRVTLPPAPPAPPAGPQLIRFAAGATSATVQGKTAAAASMQYYLAANARQTMSVKITAADAPAYLSIWGADGTVLISDHAGATSWSGSLPRSQFYTIAVQTASQASSNFTLQVTIPPLATPVPAPTAKRINFPAGGTSATVRGTLAARGMDRYVLGANAGQNMTVDLSAPPGAGTVSLVIFGADGTVLISDHAGATHWSGRLPSKQDYFIDVKAAGAGAGYSLTVSIPPK